MFLMFLYGIPYYFSMREHTSKFCRKGLRSLRRLHCSGKGCCRGSFNSFTGPCGGSHAGFCQDSMHNPLLTCSDFWYRNHTIGWKLYSVFYTKNLEIRGNQLHCKAIAITFWDRANLRQKIPIIVAGLDGYVASTSIKWRLSLGSGRTSSIGKANEAFAA